MEIFFFIINKLSFLFLIFVVIISVDVAKFDFLGLVVLVWVDLHEKSVILPPNLLLGCEGFGGSR